MPVTRKVERHEPDVIDEIVDRELALRRAHLAVPPDNFRARNNWGLRTGWIYATKVAGIRAWQGAPGIEVGQLLVAAREFGLAWLQAIGAGAGRPLTVRAWGQSHKIDGIRPPSEFIYPVAMHVAGIAAWQGRFEDARTLVTLQLPFPPRSRQLQLPPYRADVVRAWLAFAAKLPWRHHADAAQKTLDLDDTDPRHSEFDRALLRALHALQAKDSRSLSDALAALLENHRSRAMTHNMSLEEEDLLYPLVMGLAALGRRTGMRVAVASAYIDVAALPTRPDDADEATWHTERPRTTARFDDMQLTVDMTTPRMPLVVFGRGLRPV